jgi:F-type H+-transporting ATPase subunit beta
LRKEGEHVLLFVDAHPAFKAQLGVLERCAGLSSGGSVTVIFVQRVTKDIPTDPLPKNRDARIVLDMAMRPAFLYPAVGPKSESRLWTHRGVPSKISECALECQHVLQRLRELCPNLKREEIEALPEANRAEARRAMKLQLYLTQPFNITEHFIGMPGETLSIEQTLADGRAILGGALDAVADQHIKYTGTLEQILNRAGASATSSA